MNFLERNKENLRPGNVFFTMILLTGVLGMCAYMYLQVLGVNGANQVVQDHDGTNFALASAIEGENYALLASLVAAIVTSGAALGILIGKANNEFMGGSRNFEVVALFILTLITVVILCLAYLPRDTATAQDDGYTYEAVILPIVSIILGMLTVVSGVNKDYTILGTSLFLVLAIITLSLVCYVYTLGVDEENVGSPADGKLLANFNSNQKSVMIATLSLSTVVVAAGVLHMLLERKSFSKLMSRKASPRRSPGRKSSPKRKLGTLKPRK